MSGFGRFRLFKLAKRNASEIATCVIRIEWAILRWRVKWLRMNSGSTLSKSAALIDDDVEERPSGVHTFDRLQRETSVHGKKPVTLTILKWENARPGVLSWPFDSIRSAFNATKIFRNAISWAVYPVTYRSFEAAKRDGAVLLTSESK
jgi:hypothetical protein